MSVHALACTVIFKCIQNLGKPELKLLSLAALTDAQHAVTAATHSSETASCFCWGKEVLCWGLGISITTSIGKGKQHQRQGPEWTRIILFAATAYKRQRQPWVMQKSSALPCFYNRASCWVACFLPDLGESNRARGGAALAGSSSHLRSFSSWTGFVTTTPWSKRLGDSLAAFHPEPRKLQAELCTITHTAPPVAEEKSRSCRGVLSGRKNMLRYAWHPSCRVQCHP